MPRNFLLVSIVAPPLVMLVAAMMFHKQSGLPERGRDYVARIDFPPVGRDAGLPPVKGPLDASRPLVVIDAGHGGHDPGAQHDGCNEKELTLPLAQALEARLLAGGGIRVAMTRSDDRYLLLTERSGLARRLNADLFVSIHADSADDAAISGATVYILSDRGSSDAAERLAAGENRADSVNGVALGHASPAVSAILVDLSQRRTQQQSEDFARLLLRDGQVAMAFRSRAPQSAAFIVLKAPDVPSALIEAGYISNPREAAWLASDAGRAAFAVTADHAIRVFFARQSAPLEEP